MTLFTKSPQIARTRQTLAGETCILPSGLLLPAFGGLAGLKVAALVDTPRHVPLRCPAPTGHRLWCMGTTNPGPLSPKMTTWWRLSRIGYAPSPPPWEGAGWCNNNNKTTITLTIRDPATLLFTALFANRSDHTQVAQWKRDVMWKEAVSSQLSPKALK